MTEDKNQWSVVIVGGGQAGLAAGYYLKKKNTNFVILDENDHVGGSWEKRWDSLHLFTPSQYDGLPGMKFPMERNSFPKKNQVARYLEDYAEIFKLPIRSRVKVKKISLNSGTFLLETSEGIYHAEKVVVASGTHPVPKIPAFASELSDQITQIHSSGYKNPDEISTGDVLVVGAGTSGVEIALELAKHRKTYISGNPTFHIPDNVFKYAGGLYWWFVNHILTVKTPIGRKVKSKVLNGGGPLINISVDDLDREGVTRLPKMKGVKNGLPVMEDGTVVKVKTVIWCTGFKPDFSWIDMDVLNEAGWPLSERGVSQKQKGLYFMGMPFQFGLASGLIGGVGRDAKYVSTRLLSN